MFTLYKINHNDIDDIDLSFALFMSMFSWLMLVILILFFLDYYGAFDKIADYFKSLDNKFRGIK